MQGSPQASADLDDIKLEIAAPKEEFVFNPNAQVFKPTIDITQTIVSPVKEAEPKIEATKSDVVDGGSKFNLNAKFFPTAFPQSGENNSSLSNGVAAPLFGSGAGGLDQLTGLGFQIMNLQYQLQMRQLEALEQQNQAGQKKKKKKNKKKKNKDKQEGAECENPE